MHFVETHICDETRRKVNNPIVIMYYMYFARDQKVKWHLSLPSVQLLYA